MPVLYQWNGNVWNLNDFSSLISPEVVQMILGAEKMNISSKWRYFRLSLFLIFEHNVQSLSVTSQWRHIPLCVLCGVTLLTNSYSWWRYQIQTFPALLAICAGNSPVTGELPTQRPVTQSFDVFCHLRLNIQLSKQSWGWWFETLSRPLWRHCNVQFWRDAQYTK